MPRKNIFTIIFSAVFLLLYALLSAMVVQPPPLLASALLTTWYVDATMGDDNNNCLTPGTACLTVGEAASRASHGDTIQIAAGIYDESLDLSLMLTLVGAGTNSTFLEGGNAHRILTASSSQLTVADLTIRNGRSTNENGSAIYNLGNITLKNVVVMSNTAVNGGGTIYNGGTLNLQNSQISHNSVDHVGGGIYTWYNSTLTATNSILSHNEANQGGGLYNLGNSYLQDSTLSHNFAALFGGGLTVFGGGAIVNRVAVFNNESPGYGAGMVNNLGTLTVTNSTVSGNIAPNYSGIANISSNAQTDIRNSTIAYNLISSPGLRYGGIANVNDAVLTIHNSLVADNDSRNCLTGNNWASLGHNLSSDPYCDLTATGDLQSTPASLAPLGDYGGQTQTHALLPESAAIDSGDNNGCPSTDQRGITRPVDGDSDGTAVCDIGAFEARNQLGVSDVTVGEGNSGTAAAIFTVTLTPTSTQVVTVAYATADGTALAGSDYISDSASLTFSPGQASQIVAILVNGDTDDEPDETFSLNLSNPNNADIIDGQGTATILDDDGLPNLTIADVNITEGNSGSTTAQFTVSLSPQSNDVVTVDFATVAGTAAAHSDYEATNGTLTFAPHQTSQTIAVTIFSDLIDEGDSENFTVQLSHPIHANLGDDTAVGLITDDDTARVSMGASVDILEGDIGTKTADFIVTLETATAFPVTVDYSTYGGTGDIFATPGVDYEPVSGTLHFATGETEQTISVLIYGDTEAEGDKRFSLTLSNADPISIYISTSLGQILNDDGLTHTIYLPLVIR